MSSAGEPAMAPMRQALVAGGFMLAPLSSHPVPELTAHDDSTASDAFWHHTPLEHMSREQWESLCDGCGKCCLHKLADEDSGELFFTGIACRLLDTTQCRCTRYTERGRLVPECLQLTPANVAASALPASCAYRLLAEGRELPDWHPLVTVDADSTHRAGRSVRGRVRSEYSGVDLGQHLIADPDF